MNDAAFIATILATAGEDTVAAAAELLDWIPRHLGPIGWGEGPEGRGRIKVVVAGDSCTLFSLRVTGDLSFDFPQLLRKTPFADPELRRQLRDRLNSLPGPGFTDAEMTRWANTYRLKFLAEPEAMEQFKETWQWVSSVSRTGAD